MRITALVLFVLVSFDALPAQDIRPAREPLTVRVDPRVELMSLVFRLAGNPEYNMPNSKSAYSEALERGFEKFRDHPAVQTARRLRGERGVSYDAVMSLAVHVTDPPDLKEKLSFDPRPERLDERWTPAAARAFLEQARDLARAADFAACLARQAELQKLAAARLSETLADRAHLDWFDAFFGARPQARFELYVGLLNGGGCYGVGVRYPDGREEITPIIGAGEWDADGRPVFGAGIDSTVAHELCHSYTNPLVDRFADQLEASAEQIFAQCEEQMRAQAYGTWRTMMYESLVRACTVRYLRATGGAEAEARAIKYEHGRGFEWVGALAERLGEYERDRRSYPKLADFMPQVVRFFDELAPQYVKQAAAAPQIVKMEPANGARDVDPATTKIIIAFDRPMRDQSWAVVGGGPNFPELDGSPAYDGDRKVLTIPVKLKPDWEYELWLNRGEFNAFRSADGVPLRPVHVTFRTRP